MTNLISEEEIIKRFLDSDCNLWVREHSPLLQREACFKLDSKLDQHDSVISYTILVIKDIFKKDTPIYRLSLSYDTKGSVIDFPINHIDRSISLTGNLSDIAKAEWSDLSDPIINKINQISKASHHISYGPKTIS